jgi:hypothetical protein
MPTLTSVKSGRWSDPTTWDLNRLPAAGDQVVISSGHTVTYDIVEGSSNDVELGTAGNSLDVDIYGTLQFDTSATQPLRLRFKGYIRIRGTGKLFVGTPSNPMPVRVTLMKTTAGYHMIVHENNAEISLVGSPNVPYDSQAGWYRFITTLASSTASGATQITVSKNLNWQVGDWVMLPRLPSAEAQTSATITLPFIAQVTAVSGNTLTLSAPLPHDYPAGAWVAKVNRPITLHFTNNSPSYHVIMSVGSSDYIIVSGLRWVWFIASGTAAGYFLVRANVYDDNVSYTTILPHYINTNAFYLLVRLTNPTAYYHCGIHLQATQHFRHVGGVLSATQSFLGSVGNIAIENAHIWNWYLWGNLSNKIRIRNCTIFNFCPRFSVYHIVEDSIIYGLHLFQNLSTPYLNRNIFRNCKFYNYSTLGYSTTFRNRFDWLDRGGLQLADYINCELYGTWVEPYTFSDAFGYDLPKVRFVNKKVGSTVIKEQEFQAGGVITSNEATLPPEGASAYSLKFEPKNPNLPIVYDIPLPPKTRMFVYFRHDGSPSLQGALIAVVNLADQYVADPLSVAMESVDCLTYPANQWNSVVIENMGNTAKILRLMAHGTGGAVWFMSLASPIFVAEPIDIDISEDELEVDISD